MQYTPSRSTHTPRVSPRAGIEAHNRVATAPGPRIAASPGQLAHEQRALHLEQAHVAGGVGWPTRTALHPSKCPPLR